MSTYSPLSLPCLSNVHMSMLFIFSSCLQVFESFSHHAHPYHLHPPIMAPTLRSNAPTFPRLDLDQYQLLHLCIFYIYLSSSTETVAKLLNQHFKPQWNLTAKNVEDTYLHLHDTEDVIWTRAKDMNRDEKELLKNTLKKFGADNRLLNVNIIKPVAPMARMRVSRLIA